MLKTHTLELVNALPSRWVWVCIVYAAGIKFVETSRTRLASFVWVTAVALLQTGVAIVGAGEATV